MRQRKIIALSTCLLLLLFNVAIAGDLPNYEKKAELVVRAVCDNGQTSVTLYEDISYELYVAVTQSGETYFYLVSANGAEYFMRSEGQTTQIQHEAWDAKLAKASPGYYAVMHGGPHDCRVEN